MGDDGMTHRIRDYFDTLGVQEWERLEESPAARVSLAIHQRFLADHVRAGDRVLEIGAGPGRFTLELARLGARVVVADISPTQLELNASYVSRYGGEAAVEARQLLDVRDAGRADLGEFDVVTALGGPLSYVFDDAPAALRGLLALVAPGRPVVASVMSLLGAWRAFLGAVAEEEETYGAAAIEQLLQTGDLRPIQPDGHVCQLYTWSGMRDLVESCGARVVAASSSNWASLGDPLTVDQMASNPDRWASFVEHEIRACREPGALDGGTHLLFAATRDDHVGQTGST
jgi:SAM-dependent methyltransferase